MCACLYMCVCTCVHVDLHFATDAVEKKKVDSENVCFFVCGKAKLADDA